MKAMILAAGLGTRMQPITHKLPKPLLVVNGKPLIVHHIEKLACHGVKDIIINIAHLGKKIINYLGNGHKYGVNIHYSVETHGPLETGGGIVHALPLLGKDPFLLINADIYTDISFDLQLPAKQLAHLVLVDNPPHNPDGDFSLENHKLLLKNDSASYTYAGIAMFDPGLFAHTQPGKYPLLPFIKQAIAAEQASAQYCKALWHDIGTLNRLQNALRA